MWMNAASNNLLAFVRSLSQIATYVEQDVEILTEDLRVLVVKATVCIVEQYAEVRLSEGTNSVFHILWLFHKQNWDNRKLSFAVLIWTLDTGVSSTAELNLTNLWNYKEKQHGLLQELVDTLNSISCKHTRISSTRWKLIILLYNTSNRWRLMKISFLFAVALWIHPIDVLYSREA